jgi:glycosyltransferase involved in cell wall biosynthesis
VTSTLTVSTLYGLHPLDLESTAAVPRLHAQLLALLAEARPDWDFLAISPEARAIPGVRTEGVLPTRSARASSRLRHSRVGRQLFRTPWGHDPGKTLWAEAAAARLAECRPDGPSTLVICAHAEVVIAVRRALPRARILHRIGTPSFSPAAGLAADAAVVPSVAAYRQTRSAQGNQFPPPVWFIPNWVDADFFRPATPDERQAARGALGLEANDLVVAFVSRHWIKGRQVIEPALSAMPPNPDRIVLLSAGDPVERRHLSSGREAWSLGLISPGELRRMYMAADLGVVPSLAEETFGLAALEMMACGLPVVASRVGGLPEVIQDGVTGLLVDPPNAVDVWTTTISELISDIDRRARLGDAARSDAIQRFRTDIAQKEWLRVLLQLRSIS